MSVPAPRFAAVLLDLDGVLVDSWEAWRETVRESVLEETGRAVTEEEILASWGQGLHADRESWFPHLRVEEITALYTRIFPRHAGRIREVSGARESLGALRAGSLRLACVTNSQRDIGVGVLDRHGLLPCLDAVVCGDDVPNGKPAPDLLLRACALLGTSPGESLMVGDTGNDRGAARAAGSPFAGIGIEGDWTLASVTDLPGLLGLPPPPHPATA